MERRITAHDSGPWRSGKCKIPSHSLCAIEWNESATLRRTKTIFRSRENKKKTKQNMFNNTNHHLDLFSPLKCRRHSAPARAPRLCSPLLSFFSRAHKKIFNATSSANLHCIHPVLWRMSLLARSPPTLTERRRRSAAIVRLGDLNFMQFNQVFYIKSQ